MTKKVYKEAERAAGWREKYALQNGTSQPVMVNGERCYRFAYSKENEYQGANGAIYNPRRKAWIN